MASSPKLKLPTDVTTACYRAVEGRLRRDPVLKTVVSRWVTWEGESSDKTPASVDQGVVVTLVPVLTGEGWFSPESQEGTLAIQIEASIPGQCVDDVLNLWGAIRRAFYDPSNRESWTQFQVALQVISRGRRGLVEMSRPLVVNDPDADRWRATGQIQIKYLAPVAS